MQNYSTKLVDSSRFLAEVVTNEIGGSQQKFDELMSIAYLDEYPLSMRAARIAGMCGEKYPELFKPHLPEMIRKIPVLQTEGVKRSFMKVFSELPLMMDGEYQGVILDISIELVESAKEAIAVRSYAIDILLKLLKQFPDLKPELVALLENMQVNESSALIHKRKKILARLRK